MSGNANRATPFCGSRPPGFSAIGSSLKVTLQSGHTDVAGLAVGMEPVLPLRPPLSSSFSPAHHPIYPTTPLPPPPQRHSSYPCWARSAPRSTPLAASGAAVKKLIPTSLINNGPFLMQTLWICSLCFFLPDPIGEFWGLDRRQTRREEDWLGMHPNHLNFDDWDSHALFSAFYNLFSVLYSAPVWVFFF